MTACGKARRAASISPPETGAEPIRIDETDERSVCFSSVVSRNIIAIIVGTEVNAAARYMAAASM
jgi:hypothetical protein